MRPAKNQISLGSRPVWSASSLSIRRKLRSLATNWAHSEDADQTGRMSRLIWGFARRTILLVFITRRFICFPFPFGVLGRLWNSILSVPGRCLFMIVYLLICTILLNSECTRFYNLESDSLSWTNQVLNLTELSLKIQHNLEVDFGFFLDKSIVTIYDLFSVVIQKPESFILILTGNDTGNTYKITGVPRKDSDQPAHPGNLMSLRLVLYG